MPSLPLPNTLLPRWAPRLGGLCVAVALAGGAGATTLTETDVPFVVTPDGVTLAMLELAAVGPADHVIDLGSGDGRIVILAARRFGATGLGVEIVDDLVERSRRHAQAAGVASRVEFRREDLFGADLSRATVVTMYLLPEVNLQLRPRLLALRPGTRIVSHDYDLGDWQPDRSLVVDAPDKPVGRDRRSTLHLWVVPAHVDGAWCAAAATTPTVLRVRQHHQVIDARLGADATARRGRVEGTRVTLDNPGAGRIVLQAHADTMVALEATGDLAALRDARFVRAPAGCAGPAGEALSGSPSAPSAPR